MDSELLVRMFFALGLVLALLGGFAFLLKKWGPRLGLNTVALMTAGSKNRISLSAQTLLDARHRAVILNCDGVEHLVILGGASPVVVASNLSSAEKK